MPCRAYSLQECVQHDALLITKPKGFFPFNLRIYNRLLLNILYVINQKYGLNL